MAGSDLFTGTLDILILKAVSWGPRHGYAIGRWIRETTADDVIVQEGALYPALHRLERKGWLAEDWGLTDTGREAKYYTLTADRTRPPARRVEALDAILQRREPRDRPGSPSQEACHETNVRPTDGRATSETSSAFISTCERRSSSTPACRPTTHRRAAAQAFGDVASIDAGVARRARGADARPRAAPTDCRSSARRLVCGANAAKEPRVHGRGTGTLALGIGATTAVFTV